MAANVIELLIKAQDLASSELKKVETASGKLSSALSPLNNAMKLTGLAIVGAGVASIKMAGDLQQSLNVFKSVTGATAAQMDLVSEKARQLGKDASLPGIAAKDAAQAMTELAKAGLSVNDTLAASKGVLSLAKAGQLEVADAAKITAQALNAFKLSGQDAAKVADALSAGANASAADVQGMALGLQQSAAVANQFGVSLNDTVTTLALFANRGIQGSDAGTSLKTMLIQLASPSKQAADLMEKIGLKAYDASGQFVGMRQLAINLKESMKGLTQEQQNAALATIFGTDAFRAASFLADSAGKSYDDMSKQIGKVGAATDLAKAQNSGFNGALDNLRSTVETMATDIGTKLLPPLTAFLQKLSSSGIFDKVANNIDLIIIGLTTLGAIIATAKVLIFVSQVSKAVKELQLATKATGLFNLILSLNPIILIVIAVIALIGILIALQVRFKLITKTIQWVADAAGAAWNWIKDTFKKAMDWVKDHWELILTVMFGVVGFFVVQVIKHWDAIKNAFLTVMNAIISIATTVFNFIANNIIMPVVNVIVAIFMVFFNIWKYIMQWIIALTMYAWNFIYANVIKPVIDMIIAYFNFWVSVFQAVMNFIIGIATAAWNWIWGNVISPVINAIVAAANWLGGIIVGVWNWIANIAAGVWNAIASWASSAWGKVVGVWNQVYSFFSGIASHIGNALGGAFSGLAGAASSAFNGVKNAVKGGINWIIDKINWMIDKVNSVADKVPGAPHLGNIGRLASGTPNWAGGLTMVGERGPELVDLPKGSRVWSNTQTRDALQGGGAPTNNFYGTITINTADAANAFFNRLNQNAEMAAMGVPT